MPKPKGTTGATKMKIMAIICRNDECSEESYGYGIWQSLKEHFHIYINDGDFTNVYRHLYDLCCLDLIARREVEEDSSRTLYGLTEKGFNVKDRYQKYLEILYNKMGSD